MGASVRVLVVGEGRSDIGDLDAQVMAPGKRAQVRVEGFIPPIVRRVLCGIVKIEAQKVTILGRYQERAKLPGHGERAARALSIAASQGYDLLVFVKDVDRAGGIKKSDAERRKKLATMHDEIATGFAAVQGADHVRRVKATPCRMIEAWALGDATAIAGVADRRAAKEKCPPRPERLWGDEADPASSHPKCVLRRVLGRESNAETLEEIASAADIATLRVSCPESFGPFANELELAKASLAAPAGGAKQDDENVTPAAGPGTRRRRSR